MLILLVTLILKRSDIASEIDTDSDIAIETDYIYIYVYTWIQACKIGVIWVSGIDREGKFA